MLALVDPDCNSGLVPNPTLGDRADLPGGAVTGGRSAPGMSPRGVGPAGLAATPSAALPSSVPLAPKVPRSALGAMTMEMAASRGRLRLVSGSPSLCTGDAAGHSSP